MNMQFPHGLSNFDMVLEILLLNQCPKRIPIVYSIPSDFTFEAVSTLNIVGIMYMYFICTYCCIICQFNIKYLISPTNILVVHGCMAHLLLIVHGCMAHLLLVVHGTLTMEVVEHFQIECITHLDIRVCCSHFSDVCRACFRKGVCSTHLNLVC